MEERKLTCIGCPMGCQLQVIIKDGIVEKVTGNAGAGMLRKDNNP